MITKIVAKGVLVNGHSKESTNRIVLKAIYESKDSEKPSKYVVHRQCANPENNKIYYITGDYFASDEYEKAYNCFSKRDLANFKEWPLANLEQQELFYQAKE